LEGEGGDVKEHSLNHLSNIFFYLFIHNCLCVLGESMTPHPSFPPDLFLYVNLGAKGVQKLFDKGVQKLFPRGYRSFLTKGVQKLFNKGVQKLFNKGVQKLFNKGVQKLLQHLPMTSHANYYRPHSPASDVERELERVLLCTLVWTARRLPLEQSGVRLQGYEAQAVG
jgi:hypothetical protein